MTYKEISQNYLKQYDVSIGDTVKVNKQDISYTGILLDRPEDADDGYIVIKLSSGYNIGVAIENTSCELIEKGEKPKSDMMKPKFHMTIQNRTFQLCQPVVQYHQL